MEQTFSNDFKKFFLLIFTKELIRHSLKGELTNLQEIIKTGEKEISPKTKVVVTKKLNREEVPVQVKQIPKPIPLPILNFQQNNRTEMPVQITPLPKPVPLPISNPAAPVTIPSQPIVKRFTKPSLFIPEPKLPPHLEYLRPTPTPGVEIDLGKINSLINDPAVRVIEGNPGERVVVTGTMGTKPTDIFLSKEDIDRIINKFSEESKIPTSEEIYRVVVGNLILSAIISEVIGSRFIIKKMAYSVNKEQYFNNPFMK